MILVRETQGRTRQDGLHDYNIYIPYEEKAKTYYANIYTCMCCKDTFITFYARVSEPDTNLTIEDVPLQLLEHWYEGISRYNKESHFKTIENALKNAINDRKNEQKEPSLYTPFKLLEKEGFNYVDTYDKNSFMFALNLMHECVTTSAQMFVKHQFDKDTHTNEDIYIYLDTDNPFKYYQQFDYSVSIFEDLSKNPLFQKYERVIINDKPYYYEKRSKNEHLRDE